MIKVALNPHRLASGDYYSSPPARDEWYNRINEMKKWCRDTFGKGYDKPTRTWLWRSGGGSEWGTNGRNLKVIYFYPVFYFASEAHATWFLMRWSK